MIIENGELSSPLMNANEQKNNQQQKQRKKSLFQKIFGCCLERTSKSRINTADNEQNQEDDDSEKYHGFSPSNQITGTNQQQNQDQNENNQQGNVIKSLSQDKREKLFGINPNQSYKGGKNLLDQQGGVQNQAYQNQQNSKAGDKKKTNKKQKKAKEQAINYDSNSIYDSSSGYDVSQASNHTTDLRSSSLSTKTHNYDFDVSNYGTGQIFLLGKILQLMVLVKDQKYVIDYASNNLPDDFRNYTNSTASKELHQINSLSGNYQSMTFRDNSSYFNMKSLSNLNIKTLSQYEFNPDTIKYYRRRQVYFSKYTQGICVDAKCWPFLIPECIVQHIARRASQSNRRESIVDVSCAVGQFSIAFSNQINQVIAIEKDPIRYQFARNNASIYNVQNCKYDQNERMSFNEGVLFYQDTSFLEEQFQTNANLSDIVFIAPHLLSENINKIQNYDDPYFQSSYFYDSLRLYLKKAFKIAPQVILFTPRNVKIIDIVDLFTDAIKENLNKVKKCSIEIEKHFVNDHLKYICFYFGEFGREEISSQQEFKYINQQLEKCYTINNNKQKYQKQTSIQKNKPIRIHQQVFNELGKFQLLNIVYKFNFSFKIENMKISEDQTLLSLFYAYLISHNFMSQARISYMISRKQYTNSNLSSNTNNFTISILKDDENNLNKQGKPLNDSILRRVSSFTIQQASQIKNSSNNILLPPSRTATQTQSNQEENTSQLDNQISKQFDQINPNTTWDEEYKQESQGSKFSNFVGSIDSQKANNLLESRNTERTLSSNSNLFRSTTNDQNNYRNTRIVYQNQKENRENNKKKFSRNGHRTLTNLQRKNNLQSMENILDDFDDKEVINKHYNQTESDENIGDANNQEQFFSETDSEEDYEYEYEDDSSFNKNQMNASQITNNQLSFLHKTQRVYESKLEGYSDRTRGPNDIKKSQLSNSSQQTQDQDQLVVFHFNFFEQNKNDLSFNMNTSFNLMNTSRLIAQEMGQDQNQSQLKTGKTKDRSNFIQNENDAVSFDSDQKCDQITYTVQNCNM
ncbi:RNA cap guanine-N2 methyltransferase (macronuclear) [Tetrahymena thermophila SB210]|uniref:Trimethylguanosine synthase n=1 Tax=Tetrahymena thermophila (strain SB210) TaxID=312017 RepID=I7MGF8_TETTS|nr:RNA cap guanine-N2 methyltransferase [Tetrahymena thermophila SB210]EAR85120.2 RNA cap guanine-N2 methyltransferase [Tetrahymena thermophila SB210]|eukprot:XP_001032783.2 RNA cap guanine-N2 methyltransferase [Tetrahymena thermophila SB210]